MINLLINIVVVIRVYAVFSMNTDRLLKGKLEWFKLFQLDGEL